MSNTVGLEVFADMKFLLFLLFMSNRESIFTAMKLILHWAPHVPCPVNTQIVNVGNVLQSCNREYFQLLTYNIVD